MALQLFLISTAKLPMLTTAPRAAAGAPTVLRMTPASHAMCRFRRETTVSWTL
jgi:hypothetical protein